MNASLRLIVLSALAMCATAPAALAEPADGGGPQVPTGNDGYVYGPQRTVRPPVRLTAPPPGKAQVVFFRPRGVVGMGERVAIEEGGKVVAELGNGTYAVVVTDPGLRAFQVRSKRGAFNFVAEPGLTYFVRQSIGLIGTTPRLGGSSLDEFRSLASKPSTAG